jgi:peptidyl-tRNA hydrolase, PTH1 family
MRVIAGLGNPGKKYESTRHNIGFLTVDFIAEKLDTSWSENKKLNAAIATCVHGGEKIILAKPLAYMNGSGLPIRSVLSYYKLLSKAQTSEPVGLESILTVIHDDFDIPAGSFKISARSRSAGHNGVESIIDVLKTNQFVRVRVGIRPEPSIAARIKAGDFVLDRFNNDELEASKKLFPEIFKALFPDA